MENDKLDILFEKQRILFDDILNRTMRYPEDIPGRIDKLCTATIHEAVELQRLTNWKWWKNFDGLDLEHAKEELIDIWHFTIQMSMELGMKPEDVVDVFIKKHEENRKRQREGY